MSYISAYWGDFHNCTLRPLTAKEQAQYKREVKERSSRSEPVEPTKDRQSLDAIMMDYRPKKELILQK